MKRRREKRNLCQPLMNTLTFLIQPFLMLLHASLKLPQLRGHSNTPWPLNNSYHLPSPLLSSIWWWSAGSHIGPQYTIAMGRNLNADVRYPSLLVELSLRIHRFVNAALSHGTFCDEKMLCISLSNSLATGTCGRWSPEMWLMLPYGKVQSGRTDPTSFFLNLRKSDER